MHTPRSLAEQRQSRIRGELLRGCGIMPYGFRACGLEPLFEPFDRTTITAWDLAINGWEEPYQGTFWDRCLRFFRLATVEPFPHYPYGNGERADVCIITVRPYAEDESTVPKAEQFLLALNSLHEPVSFEVFGIGPSRVRPTEPPAISIRYAVDEEDLQTVIAQLQSLYPRSAFEIWNSWHDDEEWSARLHTNEHEARCFATLFLRLPYCFPIRTYHKYDPDPLGVALAAMDTLERDEWAIIQVLFRRCAHPWAENLRAALTNPYKGNRPVFEDFDLKTLEEKLSAPLFSVQVRIAGSASHVFESVNGWASQFESPENHFEVLDTARWQYQWPDLEPFPEKWHGEMLHFREPYWPGMILNAHELAGLVHLPAESVTVERLQRVQTRTHKAPVVARARGSVLLGENTHRGVVTPVILPAEMRARHVYIAGASGTGKSTLLLNMIVQDIEAGEGVGVLDPHGDLITEVLRRIPESRIADTIYFNPADTEYPVGLNILQAADEGEAERIVAETVTAFRRYFDEGWGPRLEHILTHTLYSAVLTPGATLREVRSLLTDDVYRAEVVAKLKHPELVQFWHKEFPNLPRNALDPILNKLSPFLLHRTVSRVICQPETKLNFDTALASRMIFLANLSTGLLTEQIAGVLGTFIVTKLVNAAFRRARLPRDQRPPFYLYVDEFQNFTNAEIGFDRVLSEARKYNLVLAGLANQYVNQLSQQVRHAILGNVGTLLCFRLGTEDARVLSQEFGRFAASDILQLERGQALARIGQSSAAFNLRTFPDRQLNGTDSTSRIIERSRQSYGARFLPRPAKDAGQPAETKSRNASSLQRSRETPRPGIAHEDFVS